jgi:hypothetical protein
MSDVLAKAASTLYEGGPDPFDPTKPTIGLSLVREAVQRLGWGTMNYRCEDCAYEVRVWLSLGVEGPPTLRQANLYLACPFAIRCFACAGKPAESTTPPPFDKQPLNGQMLHVNFARDDEFVPRMIPDDAPRFVLPAAVWGGSEGADLHVPSDALVAARRYFYEGPAGEETR